MNTIKFIKPTFNNFSEILNKLMFVVSNYINYKWRNLCYSCYVVCCQYDCGHPHCSSHPALHRDHPHVRVCMVRGCYYKTNTFLEGERWETMDQVSGYMQQSACLTDMVRGSYNKTNTFVA